MQTFTDLYRYRFILTNLVDKNLKVMYRSMSLGMLWTLLNPLVMITTLTVVWVGVFGAQLSFAAMCIVALIPYNFSSYCLTGCVLAIPGNAALVTKSFFPRQVLPASIVATHLIHFGIQSILVVVVLLLFDTDGGHFGFHLLWLVPIFVVHLGFCVGSGLLVAALNTIYRDVQYIIESLLTVLFWLCPIIYCHQTRITPAYVVNGVKVDATPVKGIEEWNEWLQGLYYLNPLSGIITAYRDVLFFGQSPTRLPFVEAIVMTLIIGYLGVRTFWKHEREFADLV